MLHSGMILFNALLYALFALETFEHNVIILGDIFWCGFYRLLHSFQAMSAWQNGDGVEGKPKYQGLTFDHLHATQHSHTNINHD